MQDFRPDDDLRLNRPTRITKRPSHSPKKGNSLQIYLFIGLGIFILAGLISALWLILREPTIQSQSNSDKPNTESYSANNTASGQIDLGALANNQTTPQSNPLNTSNDTANNQLTLPTTDEESNPTSTDLSEQATDNQATSNVQSSSASTANTRSTLPLDYATSGNQPVAKQTASNSNSTNNGSIPQTSTTAKNTPQQPVVTKTIQPAVAEPKTSEPKTNISQNTNTKTLQPQAVVPERNIEPVQQVAQKSVQNQQPSTDFTQPPKPVEPPKPQPKPEIVQPAKNTTITPQTATIKNSQPSTANSRPLPPPTIQQQEILANANSAQESAATLQTQIKNGTNEANTQVTSQLNNNIQPSNNSKPVSRPSQSGPINNGNGGNFTIQVASASQADGLRKLAASKGLVTARVIETERNGGKWYILVTGSYGSRQEAQRAISTLPTELQSNGAWVRQK